MVPNTSTILAPASARFLDKKHNSAQEHSDPKFWIVSAPKLHQNCHNRGEEASNARFLALEKKSSWTEIIVKNDTIWTELGRCCNTDYYA